MRNTNNNKNQAQARCQRRQDSRHGITSITLIMLAAIIFWGVSKPLSAEPVTHCANPLAQTHCAFPYPNDFFVAEAVNTNLPEHLTLQEAYQAQSNGFHPQVATVFALLPDVPLNVIPRDGGDVVQVFDSHGQRINIMVQVAAQAGERALIILPETTYAPSHQGPRQLFAAVSTAIYTGVNVPTAAEQLVQSPNSLYRETLQQIAQFTRMPVWQFTRFTVVADHAAAHNLTAELLTATQQAVDVNIISVLPLNKEMPGAAYLRGVVDSAIGYIVFDLVLPEQYDVARSLMMWEGAPAAFMHHAYRHAERGYASLQLRTVTSKTVPHHLAAFAKQIGTPAAMERFTQQVQTRWQQWIYVLTALRSEALQQYINPQTLIWHGQGFASLFSQPVVALAQQQDIGITDVRLVNSGNWDMGSLLFDGAWLNLHSPRLPGVASLSLFEAIEVNVALQQHLRDLDATLMWPEVLSHHVPLMLSQQTEQSERRHIATARLSRLISLPMQTNS